MKLSIKILSIALITISCESKEIKPEPSIENCGYQNFEAQCEMKVDSAGLHDNYWRFSDNCDHYFLSPNHLTIKRAENEDYIFLENVKFMFTVNYELRIKWTKEIEPGLTIYHFSKYPDVQGCQVLCPDNNVITIPKGLAKGQEYEVVINAFCGRILLYNESRQIDIKS